jgi:hypothetical protein
MKAESAPAGGHSEDPKRDEQTPDDGQPKAAVSPEEDQLARQAANDKNNPDNDGNDPTHRHKVPAENGRVKKVLHFAKTIPGPAPAQKY